MIMLKLFPALLLIPLFMGSCSKWIAPPYTSVDKMLGIEKGMTMDQVDAGLGIKPYNIIHRNDSTAIFEYHYRLKDRDLNNITNFNKFIHLEPSQTGGNDWFDKPSKFYVLYKDNKFSTLLTENGLNHSDYLLLKNNNLMLVSQKDLVDFEIWEDATYLHKIENTQKLKANSSGKHNILYSGIIPWAPFGFKYAYMGKVGGYVSAASDFYAIDGLLYITAGFTFRLSPKLNLYLGGGIGPEGIYEDYYHEDYFVETESPVFEAGTILQFGHFSLDIGGGVSLFDFEYSFGRFGLGYNF